MDNIMDLFSNFKIYIIIALVIVTVLCFTSDIFKGYTKKMLIGGLVFAMIAFAYNFKTGESILNLPAKIWKKTEDTSKQGSQMNYYRKDEDKYGIKLENVE